MVGKTSFGNAGAIAGQQKSPAEGWAFFVSTTMTTNGYPARRWASGRRAREVMPAAMRAEVRIVALAVMDCIEARSWHAQ
jgi:hypothetical protein